MNTQNLFRALVAWERAVKLAEEMAAQAKRELLVLNGDKRTREGRAAKERHMKNEEDRWHSLVDELHT